MLGLVCIKVVCIVKFCSVQFVYQLHKSSGVAIISVLTLALNNFFASVSQRQGMQEF